MTKYMKTLTYYFLGGKREMKEKKSHFSTISFNGLI